MRKRKRLTIALSLLAFSALAGIAFATTFSIQTKPAVFDPAGTNLVQGAWTAGIGCPTNQPVATYPSSTKTGTFTDAGCPTTDSRDKRNWGLLLSKEGPTPNNAAAQVEVVPAKGQTLNELGYDIRKVNGVYSDQGSHCGSGSPRWEIETTTGSVFDIGCNTGAVMSGGTTPTSGWERLRWGGSSPIPGYDAANGYAFNPDIRGVTIKSLFILYDESYDTNPDYFGLSVLDNVDLNGALSGAPFSSVG